MCESMQLNWKLPADSQGSGTAKARRKKNYSLRDCPVPTKSRAAEAAPAASEAALGRRKKKKEKTKQPPKKRGPKPRPRPLPMSKYRRKTANMRERQRMGEINNAFDVLKDKIPVLSNLPSSSSGRCEKMTKINVLHVAINYIRALENILDTGDAGVNVFGTAVVQSPLVPVPVDAEAEGEENPATVAPKSKKKKKKKAVQSKTPTEETPAATQAATSAMTATETETETTMMMDTTDVGSGSEDSGIVDEDASSPSSFTSEDLEYPDWTELTSTLEFPAKEQQQQQQQQQQQPKAPPALTRGNLDAMLTVPSEKGFASDGGMRSFEEAILRKVSSLQPLNLNACGVSGRGKRSVLTPTKLNTNCFLLPDLGQEDGDGGGGGGSLFDDGGILDGEDFIGDFGFCAEEDDPFQQLLM